MALRITITKRECIEDEQDKIFYLTLAVATENIVRTLETAIITKDTFNDYLLTMAKAYGEPEADYPRGVHYLNTNLSWTFEDGKYMP